MRHHGNFSLPSAVVVLGKPTKKHLAKEVFADEIFVVYPLPSAALGKAFAKGKMAFAECPCVSSSGRDERHARFMDQHICY
jgi:precorrin-6B methylase 1